MGKMSNLNYSRAKNTTPESPAALTNSVLNLKVLRFDYFCEYEIISAIMQHFNFLEVLEIQFGIDANRLSKTIEVSEM